MPAKYNRGLTPKKLFFRYSVDTWGHFLMKRKFRYRATHRFLVQFENTIRYSVVDLLRPFRKQSFRTKRPPRKGRKSGAAATKNAPTTRPTLPRFSSFSNKGFVSLFFKNLFKYYQNYHRFGGRRNKLLSFWARGQLMRLRNKVPSFLYYVNKKRRKAAIRKPYIKRRSITVLRKLAILKNQQYFCLPTVSRTKNFLRKQELSYFKLTNDPAFMGIEGNILNLIFRTNLFPTTRFGYALIKLGAIQSGGAPITSPRRSLQILESFQLHRSFIRVVFRYFRRRVRRRLLMTNAPAYLSCNYRIMHFKIWRVPTRVERRFTNSYPFFRAPLDVHLTEASQDDFLDLNIDT